MESVGAVGGAGGLSFPSSLTSGSDGIRFSSQPSAKDTLELPKHRLSTQTATKRVRKVHKVPPSKESFAPRSSKPKTAWGSSEASRPPPASSLITTSSWRAGKELREKILKGEDKGVDRMDDRSSGGRRMREEISPVHQSIASESLSSSQENISAVSSSVDVRILPERKLSKEPQLEQDVCEGSSSRAKTKDEAGSRFGVALDVAGMLKDLESPESLVPPASPTPLGLGREGREREGVRLGQTRSTTLAGGGPSSKKPRYNYGEPHCC